MVVRPINKTIFRQLVVNSLVIFSKQNVSNTARQTLQKGAKICIKIAPKTIDQPEHNYYACIMFFCENELHTLAAYSHSKSAYVQLHLWAASPEKNDTATA